MIDRLFKVETIYGYEIVDISRIESMSKSDTYLVFMKSGQSVSVRNEEQFFRLLDVWAEYLVYKEKEKGNIKKLINEQIEWFSKENEFMKNYIIEGGEDV